MKLLKKGLMVGGLVYIVLCLGMYLGQEKILFHPQKLSSNHQFEFVNPFKEFTITTDDNEQLNSLLFKTNRESSKGVVFYLHGNAGSLNSWGQNSKIIYRCWV